MNKSKIEYLITLRQPRFILTKKKIAYAASLNHRVASYFNYFFSKYNHF